MAITTGERMQYLSTALTHAHDVAIHRSVDEAMPIFVKIIELMTDEMTAMDARVTALEERLTHAENGTKP